MKPEAQRIAIAEAHKNEVWVSHPAEWHGEGAARWLVPQCWTCNGIRRPMLEVDDYLNDLNACHEFENLNSSDWLRYEVALTEVIQRDHGECTKRHLINATAAQRCEAFLKAKGLWTP